VFDIVIRSLNPLLMIAMPLALGVYLYRKLAAEWRLFGVGALTFIASQIIHIPFNAWVLNPMIKRYSLDPQLSTHLVVIALLFGLSAGVFEEFARYIAYRFRLKDEAERTWRSALMFGAGHGGIEAILLGILVAYGFVRLFALKDADLEILVPLSQLEIARAQVDLFWSAPWYAAILGAVERAATICFHLSAAVIVLQAFRRRNNIWLFLAIGWHTVLDALAVFAAGAWNIYVAEALIVAAGLISLGIIFALRDPPEMPGDDKPREGIGKPIEFESQKPSIDHLEDSRYV
jgi:uncharacterized membrane protein YhfC